MRRALGVIAAAIAVTGIGAGSVVTIPRTPSSPFGDEEVIRRSFPELGSAARIDVCELGKGSPTHDVITYEPEVLGGHQVRTRLLNCSGFSDHLDCSLESKTLVYDEDPRKPFELNDDVSTDEALRVVRAFESQRQRVWPGFRYPEPPIRSIGRNGSNYILDLSSCGCWTKLELRTDASGGSTTLELVGVPSDLCF